MSMKKRFLAAVLALVMAFALLPTMARADVAFSLGTFNPSTQKYDRATGSGTNIYKSIAINYSLSIEGGESIELPTVSGFTYADAYSSDYSKVINMPSGKTAAQIAAYIRQITFNGGTSGQKVSISLGQDELSDRTFYWDDNGHYYQYVSGRFSWLEAYDAAKQRTYQGRHGYLATVMSKEEDLFLNKLSDSLGWLGGTRFYRKSSSVSNSYLSLSSTLAADAFDTSRTDSGVDYWYWACGPEAGTIFYSPGVITKDNCNSIDASNAQSDRYFNWNRLYDPKDPQNSPEPNRTAEICLTTLYLSGGFGSGYATGMGYSWNDLTYNKNTSDTSEYASRGYFVEYGDRENGDSGQTTPDVFYTVSAGVPADLPKWATEAGLTVATAEWIGRDANDVPLSTPILKLKSSAALTQTLALPAGSNVNLNLNGKTLTAPGGASAISAASGVVKLAISGGGSIIGGNGTSSAANNGTGTAGAAAINFGSASGGSTVTVGSGVTVRGGDGGDATGANSNGGAGGNGIFGSSVTVVNSGVLRGGDGGDGSKTVGKGGRAITGAYTESANYITGRDGTLLTYTITLTPGSNAFAARTVGYTSPPSVEVTLKNTGNSPVNPIMPTATYYEFSTQSGVTWTAALAPSATRTITVKPKPGLASGSRNENILFKTTQGSNASFSATFTVNDTLSVSINGARKIDNGQSTELTAVVTGGTGPFSYKWTSAPSTTTLGTSKKLTVNPTADTTYQVKVTGYDNETDTETVTVIMATYDIILSETSYDFGNAATGYSSAPAAKRITIKNNGNSPVTNFSVASTGSDYDIAFTPGVIAANGGTASFTVRPKIGRPLGAHNDTITVSTTPAQKVNPTVSVMFNVADMPVVTPPKSEPPVIVTAVRNTVVNLPVTAMGTEPLVYQWYRDTNNGSGFQPIDSTENASAASANYVTAPVKHANERYQYYCIVTNSVGSATSRTFILHVVEPNIPATGDNSTPGLWLGLMLLAVAGLAASATASRHRKRNG